MSESKSDIPVGFLWINDRLIEIVPSHPRSLQREALELVLLFHGSVGPWGPDHDRAWIARVKWIEKQAHGTETATLHSASTRALCDTIRHALDDLTAHTPELLEF